MSKQSLLLVDGDTRSLRVLEVSLRKSGFLVTAAVSVQDALDKLELHAPDLIISETTFPDGDGFELRRRVRSTSDWAGIPFIFLTAEAAIENKIRGLELGVDDYLTKPIYIKEIVTRINILLQRRQRQGFEERRDGRTRFAGRVQDMPVVDVIQTIEISRKSGVIQFVGERGRQAAIYFRDGKVIDSEAGTLQGEDAVYRLLTWSEGEFEVVFRTVRRRDVITASSQGLLMEGMRRLDEWSRLLEQLPPLTHRFEVDTIELAARLGDVPDDNNRILRLIDGKRTLLEVIDASDVGDLECLQAISRLYFEELLLDLDHGKPAKRDTGKPMPLVEVDVPTPIEEVASGPIAHPAEAEAAAETEDATPEDHDAEIMDDADVVEESEVGPLMGGYRPSSLRLIDEAVAAAQAIEPSLFDDMIDEQIRKPVEVYNGNGVAAADGSHERREALAEPTRAREEDAAKPSGWREAEDAGVTFDRDETPTAPSAPSRSIVRDDSGLRMIGSLGRDRAEASGELRPLGHPLPPLNATQRELVTILPRRTTREVSIVDPASSEKPTPPPVVTSVPRPTPLPHPLIGARPVEPPTRPSAQIALAGSGVHASRGPGAGPIALIVLAALLAGTAVFLRLRRHAAPLEEHAVIHDAPEVSITPIAEPDAMLAEATPDAASVAPRDAAIAIRASDAATAVRTSDAAVAEQGDAGIDKLAAAKALYDKAHDALDEGDYARAFELADESLKLRKTARTYLLLAQTQQRLDRIDEAIASVDAAAVIAPEFSAVWELRGRILWAARRRDEAREAFDKFLQLDPNSPKAAAIQRLMNEPR